METITLTNPKIIKYFKQHKDIEPDVAVLFFVELLEKFGENLADKMSSSINSQILSNILELKMNNQSLHENINKINTDITNTLYIKMLEIKKEYMEDVKTVVSTNSNDKIMPFLEKNNSQLIDKTTLLLTDMIPKTNHTFYSALGEHIKTFQKSLDKSLQLKEKDIDLKEYFNIFEQKFAIMLQNVMNPINAHSQTQDKLFGELNEFLNKYRLNSTFKGAQGENQLFLTLTQMFPSGEIINTTGQKASGDFLLKREQKPNILFENKDYDANVYIEEIRKFIRDIETQNMHGIFLSQRSGIASRSNYQIEFHNGCILVFVHNVEYSKEKIQIAVDMIDSLSVKMQEFSIEDEGNTISKEILEEINKEYQNFAVHKDNLIGILKDANKKSLAHIEDFKFPTLDKYLSNKFASTANVTRLSNQYTCDICNVFTTNTIKSLSAHKRAHKTAVK